MSVLLKIYFLYTNHESQNRNFLLLDKTFVYFASFMALKTKTRSFYALIRLLFLVILLCLWLASKTKTTILHDLIRTSLLVLLLHFWLQNQNSKFLCLDKTIVSCSFALFIVIKFEMRIFRDWIITLFLVLLLRLWLQKPKPEVSMTW